MTIKESGSAFLRDIFSAVMAHKGFGGTILGALLGGGGLHLYQGAEISHQVEPKTADFAKYGQVNADMFCIEQVKFNARFNAYLKEKSKDGEARNPELTMTQESCMGALRAKVLEVK